MAQARHFRSVQYASAETTSLPAMEQIPHQVLGLMVLLIPRTEPSINPQLTTPGWRLPAVIASSSLSELNEEKSQLKPFGVMTPGGTGFGPSGPTTSRAAEWEPPRC